MPDDPIVHEIREHRDAIAERFKGDARGFFLWIQEREEQSRQQGRTFVTRSPRRLRTVTTHSDD